MLNEDRIEKIKNAILEMDKLEDDKLLTIIIQLFMLYLGINTIYQLMAL